jgi:hypothetical protein
MWWCAPGRSAAPHLCLRSDHDIGRRDLSDCAVPIMAGFEPQAAFTF